MKYDYLIVGAGFFGAVFARIMTDAGKKCLIIDSRPHIAGNCYTKKVEDIDVHMYGPHIFHTNSDEIWEFVNKYSKFSQFQLNIKAVSNNKTYSLPFNMNTFHEMWGVTDPEHAKLIIQADTPEIESPKNLEEQAVSQVGKTIYETLIKGYTKKQWKKDPKELPASIIKRLPVRYTFDNNYFEDKYQGIPLEGYTKLFENLLEGIEVKLNTNFFDIKNWKDIADTLVYTGKIDEFFGYQFGELEYRTQDFRHVVVDKDNHQGTAIVNYCDEDVPHTRIIEHKHFLKKKTKKTIYTVETPVKWDKNKTPMYPINDDKNMEIYRKYEQLAQKCTDIIFGGRLAEYKYYDMHMVIGSALKIAKAELHKYNNNIAIEAK